MPNFIHLGLILWSGGCTKVWLISYGITIVQGVEGEGEGGEEGEWEPLFWVDFGDFLSPITFFLDGISTRGKN